MEDNVARWQEKYKGRKLVTDKIAELRAENDRLRDFACAHAGAPGCDLVDGAEAENKLLRETIENQVRQIMRLGQCVVCGELDEQDGVRHDGKFYCWPCVTQSDNAYLFRLGRLKAAKERLRGIILELTESIDAPEPNCGCHLNPPCADCVEWSAWREATDKARAALKETETDND